MIGRRDSRTVNYQQGDSVARGPRNPSPSRQSDPFLGKLKANLLREGIPDRRSEPAHPRGYLLHDNDLSWNAPLGRIPALAVHQSLIPDLSSSMEAVHAHPEVATTFLLLRVRFHRLSIARDGPEYALSSESRRCRRSTTRNIALLSGRAMLPWGVLQTDLTSLGVESLASNGYLLLVVGEALRISRSPYHFYQTEQTM